MKETIGKTFLAKIRALAEKYESPEVVETAMIRMMLKTKKKLQAIYVKDLLQTLYKRDMGTPEVFHLTKRLCRGNKYKRKEITRLAMKERLKDAWNVMRKEIYEEQEMWRQLKKIINNKNRIQDYNEVWYKEKTNNFEDLRKKRRERVKWIAEKYYSPETITDMYKDVHVGDQQLDERFNVQPECYGNTSISKQEIEILKIHPKYTVFDKICKIDCEAEIEKSMTKIRWQKEKEKQETKDKTKVTDRTSYNVEKKEFNFNEARSTDLPFNTETYMPKPLETTDEIKLQCLKNELIKITDEYAENNRNSLSNLSKEQKAGLKSLKKRQKNKEIVVFQTDKSGKMIVDSPENYIEGAKAHFQNDDVVTIDEYNTIEELIKCTYDMLVKDVTSR